jgi:hypothetical protein
MRLVLTSRGWVRLLRPEELALIEIRRLVRRLEARRSYRERRARAHVEPEPRDMRSVLRQCSELTAAISEDRLEELWRRHLQRRRRR